LHPTNPINPGLPTYRNFFQEYTNAPTSADKLNVVRELYRILAPNSTSFSNVKSLIPDTNYVNSRHIHQQVMIQNQPFTNTAQQAAAYFTYNPNQYNANWRTNLDTLIGLPVSKNQDDVLEISPLDQETVVDKQRPIIPIFPKPIYAPFGLGYRRCAGEIFVYLVTEKLLEKFAQTDYEDRCPYPYNKNFCAQYPLISVAPFKQVRDSIFVKSIFADNL
jgi:hypothetical protein